MSETFAKISGKINYCKPSWIQRCWLGVKTETHAGRHEPKSPNYPTWRPVWRPM